RHAPTGSDRKRYSPAESVTVVSLRFVSTLVAVTFTPGTAAPELSRALPRTVAVTSARSDGTRSALRRGAANRKRRIGLKDIGTPSTARPAMSSMTCRGSLLFETSSANPKAAGPGPSGRDRLKRRILSLMRHIHPID